MVISLDYEWYSLWVGTNDTRNVRMGSDLDGHGREVLDFLLLKTEDDNKI